MNTDAEPRSAEENQPAKPALSGVKGAAVTTAQMFTNPGAFLNWHAWFLGLYSNSITAGATWIGSWLSSNSVEGSFKDVNFTVLGAHVDLGALTKDVGMSFKTAMLMCALHVVAAAAKYVSQTKGLPPGVSASPFSFKRAGDPPSGQ